MFFEHSWPKKTFLKNSVAHSYRECAVHQTTMDSRTRGSYMWSAMSLSTCMPNFIIVAWSGTFVSGLKPNRYTVHCTVGPFICPPSTLRSSVWNLLSSSVRRSLQLIYPSARSLQESVRWRLSKVSVHNAARVWQRSVSIWFWFSGSLGSRMGELPIFLWTAAQSLWRPEESKIKDNESGTVR